jgi:tetratricopeptide (TPR) repeat protein
MARVPTLQRYCDLIARAHAQLSTSPDAAKRSAEEADKALPGRASPQVILGRASLALGDAPEAQRAFERARAIDPRSLEDPPTLHDRARALLRTGNAEEALTVYRALVPRIDLLPTNERRIGVLLEAAFTSMAIEGAKAAGQARADEAIGYLREARQRPPSGLTQDVLVALALALDRGGERAQADVMLSEAARSSTRARGDAPSYVSAPEDRLAIEGIALESTDRDAALKSWEAYLGSAGGRSAWVAAARGRIDALRKGGGRDGGKGQKKQGTKAR